MLPVKLIRNTGREPTFRIVCSRRLIVGGEFGGVNGTERQAKLYGWASEYRFLEVGPIDRGQTTADSAISGVAARSSALIPFSAQLPDLFLRKTVLSSRCGLIEIPDDTPSWANPACRIFTFYVLGLASKSRQNFAFVFSGYEEKCVESLI
jgi:hypothetical protein